MFGAFRSGREQGAEGSLCLLNYLEEVSIVRYMKRISFFLTLALLVPPVLVRAQDAATEERLNKLSAQIQDLIDAKNSQNKQIDELARALEALQQQINKPNASYASQEDVKLLAEKLQEIDRKRLDDNERILKELKNLSTAAIRPAPPRPAASDSPPVPSKGYEYVIQQGDTLHVIIAAYKEKNIKITLDQILKANPGLKPEKLRVGQKIFIPAPTE